MIGIQSLWTGTPKFQLTRGLALIHTLSAALAEAAFPATELVTDRRGFQIAERLGWRYTTYVKALDGLCPPHMAHIWALGKLRAISLQCRPFCHLDNDVLLLNRLPPRITLAPLFAQNEDRLSYYSGALMNRAISESYPKRKIFKPYNTGVIGGTNHAALAEYGRRSIAAATRLSPAIDGTTASMAVEQYWLGEFAHEKCLKIEPLLDVNNLEQGAAQYGYVHLVGQSKDDPHYQSRCEIRLWRDFPEAYKRFNLGWQRLGKLNSIAA